MRRAPTADAPFLPVMETINAILGRSRGRIPPARTIAGEAARVRQLQVAGTHAFVSANENSDIAGEAQPHWITHTTSGGEVAELIEPHIDYVDDEDRSVHLAAPFMAHYRRRDDGALRSCRRSPHWPLVSADAYLIHADGFDRKRGIVFNVDKALMKIMPRRQECDHCHAIPHGRMARRRRLRFHRQVQPGRSRVDHRGAPAAERNSCLWYSFSFRSD
jgi:hypothetical protein